MLRWWAMVAGLALFVAACGGDDDAGAPTATVSPGASSTAERTVTSATAEASATADRTAAPTDTPAATATATPSSAPPTATATTAAATPTSPPPAPTATPVPPTPTPAPQPQTVGIALLPASFSPASVTINAGDTVVWNWGGGIPHTVTSSGGFPSDPAGTKTEGSYSFTFTAPGTYDYYCVIHEAAGMTGRVVVQ